MPSSGILRRVALVRTDVSDELSASVIRVKVSRNQQPKQATKKYSRRTSLLVTAKVVPSSPILVTQLMEAMHSSEMSALTRATQPNIPVDGILYSHRRENLQSYIATLFRPLEIVKSSDSD
jgi:hypothetical protein